MSDEVLRILLAIVAGGLIGIEREYRDKSAGFRTTVAICLGATIFTMLSFKMGEDYSDPVRISANIVTGVGFIGAGVIMRGDGRVAGLTTSAIIWLVAALGMAIGAGHYDIATAATGAVLAVLWIFPFLEERIDNLREMRTYKVSWVNKRQKIGELDSMFRGCGLKVFGTQTGKSGDKIICSWKVYGAPASQNRAVDKLLEDDEVLEFHW